MQALRADTATVVRIGPFVDKTDGFTPETGVTLAGGGDNADEAELLKAAGAATVDISANVWAAIANCDGWYDLTLTAGNLDTEGVLTVVIQNDSEHLPVHKEFMVMNAPAFDALYAVAATDYLPVDLVQMGGVTQSATDLKDFADAGYDPATNKVQGVVLTDGCTANADMRGTDNAATEAKQDIIDTNVDILVAFWNIFILTSGTIGAVGNDVTHLHLVGQTYGNDELNDYILVIYDSSESEYHSVWITDWVLATALATVETLPFVPQDSTDTYWIFALKKHPDIASILAGTVTNAQGADVATDVANMIDANNRVDVGSWLGQAVTLSTGNKPDVNIDEISDDAAASGKLELLVENVLGGDNKALISTDAQDLSATLDVNTKTITNGAVSANAIATDAVDADALANDALAEINSQVVDALNTDTYAEPGQENPPATTTLVKKIGYLYKFMRNMITNDGSTIKVYNDAKAVVDQKATVSEAAGTVTRDEFATGP